MPGRKKKSTKVKNLKPLSVKASKAASVRGGSVNEGKATFHDLSFVHVVDKSSPVLMR
jgi:type VI protein secretion system component Hcp